MNLAKKATKNQDAAKFFSLLHLLLGNSHHLIAPSTARHRLNSLPQAIRHQCLSITVLIDTVTRRSIPQILLSRNQLAQPSSGPTQKLKVDVCCLSFPHSTYAFESSLIVTANIADLGQLTNYG